MNIADALIISISVVICSVLLATILLIRADNKRRDREWRAFKDAQKDRRYWAELLQIEEGNP
jgi:hypothetical protein